MTTPRYFAGYTAVSPEAIEREMRTRCAIVLLTESGEEVRFDPLEMVYVMINDSNAVPTRAEELPGKEPFKWSTGTLPDRFHDRVFWKVETVVRCWEEGVAR